jgi:hypothetical protein
MFDAVFAGLTSLAGWSTKKTPTWHFNNGFYEARHAVAEHTSGAELALVWTGRQAASTGFLGTYGRNNAGAGSSSDWGMFAAYIPPGKGSFNNSSDPLTSSPSWISLPGTAFRLQKLTHNANGSGTNGLSALFSTQSAAFTWQARGDDVILGIERDSGASTQVDHVHLWGTILGTLQHDPNDTDKEAYLGFSSAGVAYPGGPDFVDFYSVAGALFYGDMVDPTVFTTTATQNPSGAPYNAMRVRVYETVTQGSVYSNDAVKGLTLEEAIFFTSAGPADKATWNTGAMVHLRNGVWVGSDVSNGAWP